MPDKFSSLEISTCEMHTCGEPLRILESGFPAVSGNTILDKISFIRDEYDHIRRFLIHEPRGHYDMYGTVRVEPDLPDADVAFIFMHNEGYSTMCGHAIIALGRYCVDKGLVKPKEPETLVNIQCPCGLVPTYVRWRNGQSGHVRFHSVPSFAFGLDIEIAVPEIGHPIKVDIAYGGSFYAFVPIQQLGLKFGSGNIRKAIDIGQAITDATKKVIELEHPDSQGLAFLYGTIIVDLTEMKSGVIRQMTVFADSELDRSPTGSGTTGHIALLCAKGQLQLGCEKTFQSAVNDSTFTAKAINPVNCGKFKGVTVEVSGNGYYTGRSVFTAEAEDPLKAGFLVK